MKSTGVTLCLLVAIISAFLEGCDLKSSKHNVQNSRNYTEYYIASIVNCTTASDCAAQAHVAAAEAAAATQAQKQIHAAASQAAAANNGQLNASMAAAVQAADEAVNRANALASQAQTRAQSIIKDYDNSLVQIRNLHHFVSATTLALLFGSIAVAFVTLLLVRRLQIAAALDSEAFDHLEDDLE